MREEIAKWYFGYPSWDAMNPRVKAFCYKRADELLPIIRGKIEKGLLTEGELRGSCLGEGLYWAGEIYESATDKEPILMPQFERIAQAQLQKILGFFSEGK